MKKLFLILISVLPITGCLVQADPPCPSGMTMVYSHDGSGNALSGSLQDLIDAVTAGSDVKVLVEVGSNNLHLFTLSRLLLAPNGHVYGIHELVAMNFTFSGADVNYQVPQDPSTKIFGTNGKELAKVGSSTYTHSFKMYWFIK